MTAWLEKAGTAFLRAFGVTFFFFLTGIINAPNREAAVSLSIAALVGSIVMGLRALQNLIPSLSWAGLIRQPWAAWADSFSRAFLGVFVTLLTGWLAAPNWELWKSALLGVVIGAATAGLRALQGFLTKGESPAPEFPAPGTP